MKGERFFQKFVDSEVSIFKAILTGSMEVARIGFLVAKNVFEYQSVRKRGASKK